MHSTVATCTVTVQTNTGYVYIDVINYGETGNDFGSIYALDSTSKVHTRFNTADKNRKTVQTIRIEVPDKKTHTIYITYQKNSWKDENNDSLQFKVRFN